MSRLVDIADPDRRSEHSSNDNHNVGRSLGLSDKTIMRWAERLPCIRHRLTGDLSLEAGGLGWGRPPRELKA